MHFSTMTEWLNWIASIHKQEMDLGLERVKTIAMRLNLLPLPCPAIIVGGTNGKGSTVAGLESIYRAAGYKVGVFTSPYLLKVNEQVRVNGIMATDADFCEAFEKIETLRGDISLTPFEFMTLAALIIFRASDLELIILEIGLGGRLDAVNIVDADVSVVTSIDIDHAEWLGNTREAIGFEKAGIFRAQKPAVYGDFEPPASLIQHAQQLGTPLYLQGKDFKFTEKNKTWDWQFQDLRYQDLPLNTLYLQNMSIVLAVVTLMQEKCPVMRTEINKGLSTISLPARIQIVPGLITEIYDVSHNPAAVAFLAKKLQSLSCTGKTYAVFSMLADKDIVESLKNIKMHINAWYVAPLAIKRAASMEKLKQSFTEADISSVTFLEKIVDAYSQVKQIAKAGDRIIIFGSFHTVAEVIEFTHSNVKV